MSSSVFTETASRRSPLLVDQDDLGEYVERSAGAADTNLVVVLKNDRIHVDSDGLERFIEDKTINSLSVIRITSPTPSMEEEARAEEEAERSDKDSSENESADVDVSGGNSCSENSMESASAENENKKQLKNKKKKNQREIVGLEVENYLIGEEAQQIMQSILLKANVYKPKRTVEQEIWLENIKNDHCYTIWGSPVNIVDTQKVQQNSGKTMPPTNNVRMFKKQQQQQPQQQQQQTQQQQALEEEKKLVTNKTTKYTDDEDEDQHTSNAEEEEDSEFESDNFISSDTDNDRDSDLDFKVNNNNSNKKVRRKRKKKTSRKSINIKGRIPRRLSIESEDPKARPRKPMPTLEPVVMRLHTPLHIPHTRMQPPLQLEASVYKRPDITKAKMKLPTERTVPTVPVILEKVENNDEDIIYVNPNPFAEPKSTKIINKTANQQSTVTKAKGVKEIIIDTKINTSAESFTDISTLFEEDKNSTGNATSQTTTMTMTTIKVIKLTSEKENKVLPLVSEMEKKLPPPAAAIQASECELAAEADKQLDLINSFVTDELKQPKVNKESGVESEVEGKMADKSIPAIVKMLEGEDTHTIMLDTNTSLMEENRTSSNDVNNANMNAVDLMPPDILDHVTNILKNDPALQQVVIDDSVFAERDETELTANVTENTQLTPQIVDIINITTPIKEVKQPEVVTPFPAALPKYVTSTPKETAEQDIQKVKEPTVGEDWKKVKLGNGRVISLPPIEAPTTRARRRAQTTKQKTATTSMNVSNNTENEISLQSESKLDVSQPASNVSAPATELSSIVNKSNTMNKSKGKKSTNKSKLQKSTNDSQDITATESQDEVDDDDPNKLWCICRKPHGNRFMICCDSCENWFHGKCVGVSSAQGKILESENQSWNCPQCLQKLTNTVEIPPAPIVKRKRKIESVKSKSATEPQKTLNTTAAAAADTCVNKTLPVQLPTVIAPAVDEKSKTVGKVACFVTQVSSDEGFKKTAAQKKIMNAYITPVNNPKGDPCLICKHPSRIGAIYCSDDCIKRHANNAAQAITKFNEISKANSEKKGFEDLLLMADVKPKVERINVIERKSGNILSGAQAPTLAGLKKWLLENPTYEVIMPGTLQANELENKQNKQKQTNVVKPLVTPTKMTVTKVVVAKEATPPKKLVRQISNTSASSSLSVQKQLNKSQDATKEANRTKPEHTDEVAKSAAAESNGQPEKVRNIIVKTLTANLRDRMINADDKVSFKLKDEEIEDYARGVEAELYRFYNGESNVKYKYKYRQLMFNIKDAKNQTLFRKIFYKEVTPVQLAHMSSEELASQELAQWRKQENQHQLDIITKTELDMLSCSKNLVVKTHKGEEIIDLDHSDLMGLERDALNSAEDASLMETDVNTSNIDEFYENIQSSIAKKDYDHLNKNRDNEQVSSTATKTLDVTKELDKQKHKDRERERDREKEREKAREREREKEREKHERRHRSRERQKSHKRSKSHSRSGGERSQERQERAEKRHKYTTKDRHRDKEKERKRDKERYHERERERERSKEGVNERKQSTTLNEQIMSKTRLKDKKEQKEPAKKPQKSLEAFNLIDLILENRKTVEEAANLVPEKKRAHTDSPATVAPVVVTKPASVQLSPQEPTSTITSPPQDTYGRYTDPTTPTLWSGNLNMVEVASFHIKIKPFLGNSMQLNKLLPNELDVVGRIGPDTVWDYITKIKKSPNKEIVLVQLLPANSTETSAYQILLQYLDKRNRLGVIKTASSQIKDFYMFPLVAGKRLPAVLQSMENTAFFEDNERPDMLIGIIIRVFSKRLHTQPGTNNASLTLPTPNKIRRVAESSAHKRHSNLDPSAKDDGFDIDAIIMAPIAGKIVGKGFISKPSTLSTSTVASAAAVATATAAATLATTTAAAAAANIDLDEPYSPGSTDDDMPLLPILNKPKDKSATAVDPEYKNKINELNKQIAARKKEIAGLLDVDQSKTTSNVLANISIPSNLSQILASIKSKAAESTRPLTNQPAVKESVSSSSSYQNLDLTYAADEEYNPEDDIAYAYSSSKIVKSLASTSVTPTSTTCTSTSRLATLSEAELLSMVPDDMLEVQAPSKNPAKTLDIEPPPPGV